jgi:SAM-dependent methyltransferase
MGHTHGGLWGSGDAYERYMGRWSRRVAPRFLEWLSVPPGATWTDVGCGTGALTSAVLAGCEPRHVVGVEPSEAFIDVVRARVVDPRFECRKGSGDALPLGDAEVGAAVSGLVLNFVPNPYTAVAEMRRVVAHGGRVALYVWDYAGHMQVMRYFFDVATELDPGARAFDDGAMAPVCRPGPLRALFEESGLAEVDVESFDLTAAFERFDDYWEPFLGGTGSAPRYCASLTPDARDQLRQKLRERVPTGPDGEILMALRAWGVRGTVRAERGT